jgi:carboxyl-terminal processing protease
MKKSIVLLFVFSSFLVFSQPTQGDKFSQLINLVDRFYVDTVNSSQLTETAIIALLEKLDPHSTYISKEEVADANSSINGSFVGVGIRFQILKDTVMVVATIPGGPSEKLGILPGDKIVRVNNESIAGIGIKNSQVRDRLLGELGTKVSIEILRKQSEKLLEYTIKRDKIPLFSVDAHYMLTKDIGYIKLSSFSRTTVEEIQQSIKNLKDKGMKHLVFDLQGNGGGLLDAAQKVADEFLSGDKLVVYSEGRAQPRTNLKAGNKGLWEKGSLIVLTDEYSASASEIVSGAIQDWDRGIIIGRRTYGKGLVQRPFDLIDGSQIRLTMARYYTPSGRFIQKPYDDIDSYKKDLSLRYKNGEFVHIDSIKLPDSLRFETLELKRTVFGGGGIMPDLFVPLDTTGITDYFSAVVRGGHINNFSLEYVDKKRAELIKQYTDAASFKSDFTIDSRFLSDFNDYVKQNDPDIKFDEQQWKESAQLISYRLKAGIAQNLWGYSEFFQVYNDTNEIVQRAIECIEKKEYDRLLKNTK